MINLLDPEEQRQLKAARLNVKLRRFVVLSLVVVLGVGVIYGTGFWLALNDRSVAEASHTTAEQELTQYAKDASEAAAYRQNLSTAKQILSNQMVFSDFLTSLGALMPPNTIIGNLSLSTKASAKTTASINFTTRAKSYDDVLKIKQAFETSTLFSDVQILNTNVPEKVDGTGIQAAYPYEATFQVVVNALKGTSK